MGCRIRRSPITIKGRYSRQFSHRVVTDVYQNVQNAAARLLAGHGHRQHGLRQVMRDELEASLAAVKRQDQL